MSSSAFTVLVAYDTAETGAFAFSEALRMTQRIPGSDVHVVHVMHEGTKLDAMHDVALAIRNDIVRTTDEDRFTEIHLRAGDPAREVANVAKEVGADVVVMGASPRYFGDWLRRSNSARIQRALRVPVVIAEERPEAIITIEAPCDDCVEVRERTNGRTYWCARHAEHHVHGHHYSYSTELPFAQHDSEVVPTGVSFG